jgi:hypothetical protein
VPAETRVPRRASRWRLYIPFALLALLAITWSATWFIVRGRTLAGMDEWLAAEAAAGRQWTCLDRRSGGYPFRVEVACSGLTLERPDFAATLGPVLAVAQIYRLGHIIIEARGPLQVASGSTRVDSEWRLLQASVILESGALQRLAIAADDPKVKANSPGTGPLDLSARRVEAHARPDPADRSFGDLAVTMAGAVLPGLDALVGGSEAADLDVVLRVSRLADLPARPVPSELERWRSAGGQIEILRAGMVKGPRRFEAQGRLAIDAGHRPTGEIRGEVAAIEGLLGRFVGDKAGMAGALLGALLGGGKPAEIRQRADPNAPRMKPIPPLRIENGRLSVGPLQIPNIRIPALY